MVDLRLDHVAEKTQGKILQGSPSLVFQKYSIDSRCTAEGELFFALVAERNGHDYVRHAVEKGASGAVISQEIAPVNKEFGLVQVNDTLIALQDLARWALSEQPLPVIGITGSIGKTTTKEFAASLLSSRLKVLKSEGNYNNHIGLPLSLLNLQGWHEVAVLEMGISTPGEIAVLTRIAPPDVAVITNINPVHLQFFQSIDEIAIAKKEILTGMKEGGIAVLNGDDPYVTKLANDWGGKKIFFGLSEECDIHAKNIQRSGLEGMSFDLCFGQGEGKMFIPFFYTSYLYNFLAAVAVASVYSISLDDIRARAKSLKTSEMRGNLMRLKRNIVLIDDSYNSNPAALASVLKDLGEATAGRKIAILGDMLELGEQEVDYHVRAGTAVKNSMWDALITVGPLSRHMAEGALSAGMRRDRIFSFEDSDKAAEAIWPLIKEGDLILVKGSRGMKTEKIVKKIKQEGS